MLEWPFSLRSIAAPIVTELHTALMAVNIHPLRPTLGIKVLKVHSALLRSTIYMRKMLLNSTRP